MLHFPCLRTIWYVWIMTNMDTVGHPKSGARALSPSLCMHLFWHPFSGWSQSIGFLCSIFCCLVVARLEFSWKHQVLNRIKRYSKWIHTSYEPFLDLSFDLGLNCPSVVPQFLSFYWAHMQKQQTTINNSQQNNNNINQPSRHQPTWWTLPHCQNDFLSRSDHFPAMPHWMVPCGSTILKFWPWTT